MSEFITVQVGQCGNQIGSAFWPLVLHEYGIQTPLTDVNLLKTQKNHIKHFDNLMEAFHSFFHIPNSKSELSFKTLADLNAAKVKARAILIDMEDSVVSRFKEGPLRQMFDRTCTVTNYPGSANNWAVGYYTHGTEYEQKLEETIRRVVEKTDNLHGFLLMHSLGGGTGSGLGSATLKLLHDIYPRIERFVSSVYPSGTQDVITAPYNVLLSTKKLIEHSTCTFPIENKALLDICKMQMNIRENVDQIKYNVSCRPFQDMNSIVVNMLLHLTCGSRFPGSLNMDMNELAANLVPYENLHFLFSSVSPVGLTAFTKATVTGPKYQDELFMSAWSRNNQLIKIDPLQPDSVIMGAAHVVRGHSSINDLKRNVERFQNKAHFTPWSKETMKLGLCSVPPAGHPSSLLCLLNSSSMASMFKNIVDDFDTLYRRKAHVHHYLGVDGFEKSDFLESRESILNMYALYNKIKNQKRIEIPRLQVL